MWEDIRGNKKHFILYMLLFIVICWPYLVYKIIITIRNDKSRLFDGERSLKIYFFTSLIFALAGTVSYFDKGLTTEMIIITFNFYISSIVFGCLYIWVKKELRLFKKYIEAVIKYQTNNLGEISRLYSIPYVKVKEDINALIKRGVFPNAYINDEMGEIFYIK